MHHQKNYRFALKHPKRSFFKFVASSCDSKAQDSKNEQRDLLFKLLPTIFVFFNSSLPTTTKQQEKQYYIMLQHPKDSSSNVLHLLSIQNHKILKTKSCPQLFVFFIASLPTRTNWNKHETNSTPSDFNTRRPTSKTTPACGSRASRAGRTPTRTAWGRSLAQCRGRSG
jgi:hypothetical protein